MIVDLAGVDLSQSNPDGWVIESLSEWWDLPDAKSDVVARPDRDGDFDVSRVFRDSVRPTAVCRWMGSSEGAAEVALMSLRGLVSRGKVPLTVTGGLGALTRMVEVRRIAVSRSFEWWNLPVSIDMLARDPLMYGVESSASTGLPTSSSGLVWPLWSTGTSLDWGTPGNSGRLTLTNSGSADVAPWSIRVAGPFPSGFSIVEVETGRLMQFDRVVDASDVITLNPRTGRALINGASDVTAFLTVADWPMIPAGSSRSYQFLAPSGSGVLSMSVRPAFL